MRKIILITSIFIVLGIALWYIFLWNVIPDIKPIYKKIEIKSEIDKTSIFLKKKVWGITFDNSITVISKSPIDDFEIDDKSNYIFKNVSTFLYRFNKDSLIVYIPQKVLPSLKFNSKIKVIQVELNNVEMMNLLENDSYKKRGLLLF